MLIGYARVSTEDQNLDGQVARLKEAGCERIFTDKLTGATVDRPGLNAALDMLRSGDVLIVWKMDRLIRSLKHLLSYVDLFIDRKRTRLA